jgi:hypothetical protein
MKNRRKYLNLPLVICGFAGIAQTKTYKSNIIFFFVDEMGWQETSVTFWKEKTGMKDRNQTPNREFFRHFRHFYDKEPYSVSRKGDWKLIYCCKDGKSVLYNISEDISESNNWAAENHEKTREMAEIPGKYLREMNGGRPFFKETSKS